jgi:hypothetical protein
LPALRAGWRPLSDTKTVDAWRSAKERTAFAPGPELLDRAEREMSTLRELLTIGDRRRVGRGRPRRRRHPQHLVAENRADPGPVAQAAYALRATATINRVAGDRDRWLSRHAARVTAQAPMTHRPARTSSELVRRVSKMVAQNRRDPTSRPAAS